MIEIILNGEQIWLEKDVNIYDFLQMKNYNLDYVAVEKDYEILVKTSWKNTQISSGKIYEIVEFVGGG